MPYFPPAGGGTSEIPAAVAPPNTATVVNTSHAAPVDLTVMTDRLVEVTTDGSGLPQFVNLPVITPYSAYNDWLGRRIVIELKTKTNPSDTLHITENGSGYIAVEPAATQLNDGRQYTDTHGIVLQVQNETAVMQWSGSQWEWDRSIDRGAPTASTGFEAGQHLSIGSTASTLYATGNFSLYTGNSKYNSGHFSITTGYSDYNAAQAGNITVYAGYGKVAGSRGGNIKVQAGGKFLPARPGTVLVRAGYSLYSGTYSTGAHLGLYGSTSSLAGGAFLYASTGTNTHGGSVQISATGAGTYHGHSGQVRVRGGSAGAKAPYASYYPSYVTANGADYSNYYSGDIFLFSGDGAVTSAVPDYNSGSIIIRATSKNRPPATRHGDVVVVVGPSGTYGLAGGDLILRNIPTVAPARSKRVYVDPVTRQLKLTA